MKKRLLISIFLIAFIFSVFAVEEIEETDNDIKSDIIEAVKEVKEEIKEAMDEVEGNEKHKTFDITYNSDTQNSKRDAIIGVYFSDIDFEDAYKMHYEHNYGVLIKSVQKDGPAEKAGIMKGDIIMEFDGEKAYHDDYLRDLIQSRGAGKTVRVKYFRYDSIKYTDITIGLRKTRDKTHYETYKKMKDKKISVGFGGGSWIPVWYQPDVIDINSFLKKMGFQEETFSEKGFLLQGGGGKLNVGKGWFIGGMGAGYKNSETTKHDWAHHKNEGNKITNPVSRHLKYGFSYGGVTLDKRFALNKKIVISGGFLLGAGRNYITINQKDNNGNIDNFDFENDPSGQFDEDYIYTCSLNLKKKYIIFQPKAMIMYRILPFLRLRAEIGYLASYSPYGLKTELNGESIKNINPLDMEMNGLTFTIGPWFGF